MSIHELPMPKPTAFNAGRDLNHAAPVLWAALLALSATGSSWALACVTPLAAFALVAARTLSLKTALGAVALIWLSNQSVGFLFLSYPPTLSSILWGLAMGAAALAATVAVFSTMRLHLPQAIKLPMGLLAAFAVYEGSLVVIARITGSMDGFTLPIVGRFLLINAEWAAGLLIVHQIIVRTMMQRTLSRRRAF